jgi:hypothetical protein
LCLLLLLLANKRFRSCSRGERGLLLLLCCCARFLFVRLLPIWRTGHLAEEEEERKLLTSCRNDRLKKKGLTLVISLSMCPRQPTIALTATQSISPPPISNAKRFANKVKFPNLKPSVNPWHAFAAA